MKDLMELTASLEDNAVIREEPITLISTSNPTPIETVYLSNIDQTVAFPVETVFFYEGNGGSSTADIIERVKRAVSDVFLIPYYFLAGRLSFNMETKRLELVCSNAGVLFAGAKARVRVKDLGDVSVPNPSFQQLILRVDSSKSLSETPIFTIQVTRFSCGGYSLGFVTNHCILDGRAAAEMLDALSSICRGSGMKIQQLNLDKSSIKPRNPPRIQFPHPEYTTHTSDHHHRHRHHHGDSFTLLSTLPPSPFHAHKVFSFSPSLINLLKAKSLVPRCTTFEAMVAHVWIARTRALFSHDALQASASSSVLFAVDVRAKMAPPLPAGFVGNAVITAAARAKYRDLDKQPFGHAVGLVREAIARVRDEYVRSVIDWLEVNRGVPEVGEGAFYLSAWWKLPFHELDFGNGRPLYGGPVVSAMDEFVLLLGDGRGGINVWMVLEKELMNRFSSHVFDV